MLIFNNVLGLGIALVVMMSTTVASSFQSPTLAFNYTKYRNVTSISSSISLFNSSTESSPLQSSILLVPTPLDSTQLLSSASISSSLLSTSSSTGIGAYIANGLGLSSPTSLTSPDSSVNAYSTPLSTSNLSRSSVAGTATSNAPVYPPFAFSNGTNASHASLGSTRLFSSIASSSMLTSNNISSHGSHFLYPTQVYYSAGNTTVSPANITGTAAATPAGTNMTYSGGCWDQWQEYWTQERHDKSRSIYIEFTTNASVETLTTRLDSDWYAPAGLTTYVTTELDGVFNGAPAVATYTTTATYSTPTWTELPPAVITTTLTNEYGSWSSYSLPNATITPPPCALPSIVPQCQSAWDSWAFNQVTNGLAFCSVEETTGVCSSVWSSYWSAGPVFGYYNTNTPYCTQASLASLNCSLLGWSYMQMQEAKNGVWAGGVLVQKTTYTTAGSVTTSNLFPSDHSLAPGCTLGCQDCRMNGGTVQLLYWPPATANASSNHTSTGPSTLVTLGVTLTSPTPYISFDSLYASDSCSFIGGTYTDKIVAITRPDALESLWGFQSLNGMPYSAFLNFTDLYQTPVPNSIYNRQPRCAYSSFMAASSNGSWECPRIAPYNPILGIPMEVRDLDPAWKSCLGALTGVYDPPTALSAVASVAGPSGPAQISTTSPAATTSIAATPASPPQIPTAFATSTASSSIASSISSIVPGTPSVLQDSTASSTGVLAKQSSSAPSVDPIVVSLSKIDSSSDPNSSAQLSSDGQPAPSDPTKSEQQVGSNAEPMTPSTTTPSGTPNALSILSAAETGQASFDSETVQPTPAANSGVDQSQLPQQSLATVGGQTIAPAPSKSGNVVVLGSQSLNPGQVTTISGTPVSIGASGVVIGSATTIALDPTEGNSAVDQSQLPQQTLATIAGQTIALTPTNSGNVVVQGSQTLSAGQVTTISGTPVSIGSSGIVIGSATTVALGDTKGSPSAPSKTEVAGHAISADPSNPSNVIIDGTRTLQEGQTITLGSTPVAVTAGSLVIGGLSTVPYTLAPDLGSSSSNGKGQAVVTVGSQTAIAVSGQPLVIGDQTLTAGGLAVIVSGETISLASAGIVVDGSTKSYLPARPTAASFDIAGASVTALAIGTNSAVIEQHSLLPTTLSIGGPAVTISGEVVSLGVSGLVIDASTVQFPSPSSTTAGQAVESALVFSAAGSTFIALGEGQSTAAIVAGGSTLATLSIGGSATVLDGQTISMGSDGLVQGTSVIPFSTLSETVMDQATFVGTDGRTVTALENVGGDNVVTVDSSATLTLGAPGTVIDGESVSLGSSGLVIGGTRTVSFSPITAVSGGDFAAGPAAQSTQVPSPPTPTASHDSNRPSTKSNGVGKIRAFMLSPLLPILVMLST